MNAKFIKRPNYSTGRKGYQPVTIEIHIMEGSLDGTDSWFQNPNSKVSAHYGIGKNGELHQYVKEEDTAWHAGRVDHPSWSLIKPVPDEEGQYINPNYYTIGIEHEGWEQSDWTDDMYQTSSGLIAAIAKRWDIPMDRDHIVGHHEIYSLKDCPGCKVDIHKLIALATGNSPLIQPIVVSKIVGAGKATTQSNLNIRNAPGSAQPLVGIVPSNIQLAYDGYTDNGESVNGNSRWYYTDEGNWFWSGGVK